MNKLSAASENCRRMNERTDGRTEEGTNERTDERIDKRTDAQMNEGIVNSTAQKQSRNSVSENIRLQNEQPKA
ncbi:hypothetical protein DPMN_064125 [Dreissena polymorpha]|uniref:Uncharacterized protein n=1 Tax=Dreissena polymorpha TaxID=45954 RepID=A0A9D4HLU5_DREPO|nr:hypothetical protein DPMN_064125 [Dreissena polymorpha]